MNDKQSDAFDFINGIAMALGFNNSHHAGNTIMGMFEKNSLVTAAPKLSADSRFTKFDQDGNEEWHTERRVFFFVDEFSLEPFSGIKFTSLMPAVPTEKMLEAHDLLDAYIAEKIHGAVDLFAVFNNPSILPVPVNKLFLVLTEAGSQVALASPVKYRVNNDGTRSAVDKLQPLILPARSEPPAPTTDSPVVPFTKKK